MNTEKNPTTGQIIEIFGPTLEFLTLPADEQNGFCVLKGVLPPGVFIPLHSHSDREDFLVLSGESEVLKQDMEGFKWIMAKAGDYIHVPGGARHAWRNVSDQPVVSLIITTNKLGKFFQETGRPVTSAPQLVTPEDLERFASVCAKYDYWIATPEENEAVGIHTSF